MKINSLMDDLRALKVRTVNVFLFESRIYSGEPSNLPEEFNLDVASVNMHPRQNSMDVVLKYDLAEDTKTPPFKGDNASFRKEDKTLEVPKVPKKEDSEDTEMSNLDKLKSFLGTKIDDIDDCRQTLEAFGCLNSSPNIKHKVLDYLNGKQDGFLEALEFLASLDKK